MIGVEEKCVLGVGPYRKWHGDFFEGGALVGGSGDNSENLAVEWCAALLHCIVVRQLVVMLKYFVVVVENCMMQH